MNSDNITRVPTREPFSSSQWSESPGAGQLAVIGSVSRQLFAGARNNLLRAGAYGKYALGGLMAVLGLLMLTGWDHSLENTLTQISPTWLTEFTTRF